MPEPAPIELDAEQILAVLLDHGVQFVVIGGFGALLHGDPGVTVDLDITPAASLENRRRLAAALSEMGAQVRVPGLEYPVAAELDAEYLARFATITLRTRHGDLDLAFEPDGPEHAPLRYERLARRAVAIDLGIEVPVASLDDIIASKEAAGRLKDLEDLARLYVLRDELPGT
jgi:sugar phosphate isomerase/epimerase